MTGEVVRVGNVSWPPLTTMWKTYGVEETSSRRQPVDDGNAA